MTTEHSLAAVSEHFKNIGVLIPAYNAGQSLTSLIDRITPYVSAKDVLVVDDGSTDDTAAVARAKGVQIVSLGKNQGKGSALSKGFEILRSQSKFESIVTLDADLQHPPECIPDFIRTKREKKADIVIGSRNRFGTAMPIHRRMSNAITSYLVSVRTGKPILDSQCGFRLIGMNVVGAVSMDSTGFEAETEFLIKAVKRGFTVQFVPIETIYDGAKSHMTNWRTTLRFIRVLLRDYP